LFALLCVTGCERNSGTQIESLLNPDIAAVARLFVGSEATGSVPVTLVDFDDDTFRRLEYPPELPRGYVLDTIESVARRKANAIILDVDLTATRSAADLDEVSNRLRRLASDDPASPAIILVRRLWTTQRGKAVNASTVRLPGAGTGRDVFQSALQRLDALVEASPNLVWSAAVQLIESDGVVRFSRAAELACGLSTGPDSGAIPRDRLFLSPAAIVAIRLEQPSGNFRSLKSKLRDLAVQSCTKGSLDGNAVLEAIGLRPFLNAQGKARIPYHFSRNFVSGSASNTAKDTEGGGRNLITGPVSADLLVQGDDGMDWGTTGDACSLIDNAAGGQRSCAEFRAQIVVMGATHVDSGDKHSTPLGMMPGMDIVANSVIGARYLARGAESWKRSPLVVGAVLIGMALALAALIDSLLRLMPRLLLSMRRWPALRRLRRLFLRLTVLTKTHARRPGPARIAKSVYFGAGVLTVIVFAVSSGMLGVDPATAYSAIWLAVSFLVLQPLATRATDFGWGLVGGRRTRQPRDSNAQVPKS
jgi:CHASE2 domain